MATKTQYVCNAIDSHRNRSRLHKLSFICSINVSQEGPPSVDVGRKCRTGIRRTTSLLIDVPKATLICSAMCGYPHIGLRRFISTTAWIKSAVGPFGLGFARFFGESGKPILSLHQCAMKTEKCRWLKCNRQTRASLRRNPSGNRIPRSGDPGCEIRRTSPRAIEDQQLVLGNYGFCDYRAHAHGWTRRKTVVTTWTRRRINHAYHFYAALKTLGFQCNLEFARDRFNCRAFAAAPEKNRFRFS
jgi:hypothetical protein